MAWCDRRGIPIPLPRPTRDTLSLPTNDKRKLLDGSNESAVKNYVSFLPRTFAQQTNNYLTKPDIDPNTISLRHRYSIFVGTWNLGNNSPPHNLSDFIRPNAFDVYAIGTQECIYETTKRKCKCCDPRVYNQLEESEITCEEHWFNLVRKAVGDGYKEISALSLRGIRMIVLVRSRYASKVSHINTGSEGTGVGNFMGNKGGVGVSFNIGPLSLCFVNVHLAAHKNNLDARNLDLIQIVGRLRLGKIHGADIATQFHALFFFGDSNYRVNLSTQQVVSEINSNNYSSALEFDELVHLQRQNLLFYGFSEGKIQFAPTYKYSRGSDSEYNLKRTPAWCDRILWKCREGVFVQQSLYTSVPSIRSSDHKPVKAHFVVGLHVPVNASSTLARLMLNEKKMDNKEMGTKEEQKDNLSINRDRDGHGEETEREGEGKGEGDEGEGGDRDRDLWNDKKNKGEKEKDVKESGVSEDDIHRIPLTLQERPMELKTLHSHLLHQYEIVFPQVRMYDINGRNAMELSQPFITFKAEFLDENLDSEVLRLSDDSKDKYEWSGNMIPKLVSSVSGAELQYKCIILVVRDRALFGDVDVVGQCCIELRPAFSDLPVPFHVPVIKDTTYNGYLMGSIQVKMIKTQSDSL